MMIDISLKFNHHYSIPARDLKVKVTDLELYAILTANLTLKAPRKSASENVVCLCCLLNILAEKFSCSAMFSKKEFAIVSILRLISMKHLMLS